MIALSIRQPWAWLIVNGHKDIENREWPTKRRGTFLVHASAGMTRSEYAQAVEYVEWATDGTVVVPPLASIERGGIVGSARIVDCVTDSRSNWFVGLHGFVLADAAVLPFRPYKGQLGFFEVPAAFPSEDQLSSPISGETGTCKECTNAPWCCSARQCLRTRVNKSEAFHADHGQGGLFA